MLTVVMLKNRFMGVMNLIEEEEEKGKMLGDFCVR